MFRRTYLTVDIFNVINIQHFISKEFVLDVNKIYILHNSIPMDQ